jgi:hypothetical protein
MSIFADHILICERKNLPYEVILETLREYDKYTVEIDIYIKEQRLNVHGMMGRIIFTYNKIYIEIGKLLIDFSECLQGKKNHAIEYKYKLLWGVTQYMQDKYTGDGPISLVKQMIGEPIHKTDLLFLPTFLLHACSDTIDDYFYLDYIGRHGYFKYISKDATVYYISHILKIMNIKPKPINKKIYGSKYKWIYNNSKIEYSKFNQDYNNLIPLDLVNKYKLYDSNNLNELNKYMQTN